jgi:hypothetical protein
MYTSKNFQSREDLIDAISNKNRVSVFESREIVKYTHKKVPANGIVSICGPYTGMKTPHTWFAEVVLKNGFIVRVLGSKQDTTLD